MARYHGPKLRITRRLGELPGLTSKQSKKKTTPGQHGKTLDDSNRKPTEYGLRLEEKQKLKYNYGLTESQLFRYIKEARRRKGITSIILLQLLEMRLDTICFTLGFAKTISHARQLINHGHITVNKKVVNIPSLQCKINDKIMVKNKTSSLNLLKKNRKKFQKSILPSHLNFDLDKFEGTINNYCVTEDIQLKLNELLIIEYYSRK